MRPCRAATWVDHALRAVAAMRLVTALGCDSGPVAACDNETCVCPAGASCDIACASPPCHIACGGDNPFCGGSCANAECFCGVGSSCQLDCVAPPCHITCAGQNPSCRGACANGTCTCGPNSHCDFVCQSGPCHATCAAGSSCSMSCPPGLVGTANCAIEQCAAGQPVLCPNGKETTCGAPCT